MSADDETKRDRRRRSGNVSTEPLEFLNEIGKNEVGKWGKRQSPFFVYRNNFFEDFFC